MHLLQLPRLNQHVQSGSTGCTWSGEEDEGRDEVVLEGGVGVYGACALQRPHERRQYGPLVMNAAPHFPNRACKRTDTMF